MHLAEDFVAFFEMMSMPWPRELELVELDLAELSKDATLVAEGGGEPVADAAGATVEAATLLTLLTQAGAEGAVRGFGPPRSRLPSDSMHDEQELAAVYAAQLGIEAPLRASGSGSDVNGQAAARGGLSLSGGDTMWGGEQCGEQCTLSSAAPSSGGGSENSTLMGHSALGGGGGALPHHDAEPPTLEGAIELGDGQLVRGRWARGSRIGSGAHGEVFLVRDVELRVEFAAKLVRPRPRRTPRACERGGTACARVRTRVWRGKGGQGTAASRLGTHSLRLALGRCTHATRRARGGSRWR